MVRIGKRASQDGGSSAEPVLVAPLTGGHSVGGFDPKKTLYFDTDLLVVTCY